MAEAKARRLSKQESRQRWGEVRDLWNQFDPIGVMDDPEWPRDEYEAYCGRTLRLLEQDADTEELVRHLEWAVCDRMGLTLDRAEAERFAGRLRSWFQSRWSGTRG